MRVAIIQHGKETKHAKNTAKLAKLCAPEINIVKADCTESMHNLAVFCHANSSVVVYPCESSQELESNRKSLAKNVRLLIIIDGSWKQAYAIFQQHTWLHAIPAFHFENAPDSQYTIRHTHFAKSLSTLEALAYSLSTLYSLDVEPFYRLQRAMQNNWRGPIAHRRDLSV